MRSAAKKMRPLIYRGRVGWKLCWREVVGGECVRKIVNDTGGDESGVLCAKFF